WPGARGGPRPRRGPRSGLRLHSRDPADRGARPRRHVARRRRRRTGRAGPVALGAARRGSAEGRSARAQARGPGRAHLRCRDRGWFEPFRIPNSAFRIGMTPGLLIFAATYVLIAAQRLPFLRLNRPAASLLGAVAMVVLGVLPLRDAYAAIDFDVLVFLLGL